MEQPNPLLREYYDAAQSARRRLEKVALGVENLAVEIATVRGNPNLGRYIQDRLRQLLCVHPEGALQQGQEEAWCAICLGRIEPGDDSARTKELADAVAAWCKCLTDGCPVHTGTNPELPMPRIVISAVPEQKQPEFRGHPVEEF